MFKRVIGLIRRVVIGIGVAALVYLAIVVVLNRRDTKPSAPPPALPQNRPSAVAAQPIFLPPQVHLATADCGALVDLGRDIASAAAANAQSRSRLAVAPFGVAETGWQVYEPLIARTIGTGCAGDSFGFAHELRAWQAAHGIAAAGQIDTATMSALAMGWLQRRPFVAAMRNGCPPSPDPSRLAVAGSGEAYGGKVIMARPAALAAYRGMVAAARRDGITAPPLLTIASAWRGPDEELARCADGSCGTAAKANCSAHRTGLAFDFVLGNGPGDALFSTSPANRLALSQTPAYRWLVANADRFGFVNYPYEPWHWEWTGESI